MQPAKSLGAMDKGMAAGRVKVEAKAMDKAGNADKAAKAALGTKPTREVKQTHQDKQTVQGTPSLRQPQKDR